MDTLKTKLEDLLEDYKSNHESFLSSVPKVAEEINGVCRGVKQTWSGSYLGQHGKYYYKDFEVPPEDKKFDKEWGTMRLPDGWNEKETEEVNEEIESRMEIDFDLKTWEEKLQETLEAANKLQAECLDLLSVNTTPEAISELEDKLEDVNLSEFGSKKKEYAASKLSGSDVTRDVEALVSGKLVAPHLYYRAVAYEGEERYKEIKGLLQIISRLVRRLQEVGASATEREEGEQIDSEIVLIEEKVFDKINNHPDLCAICEETNKNVAEGRPYASMLLIKSLLPRAVVRKFQTLDKEEEIRDDNGEYHEAKKLINKSGEILSTDRIKDDLLSVKIFSDSTQHIYSYTPSMNDVNDALRATKVFLADLFS